MYSVETEGFLKFTGSHVGLPYNANVVVFGTVQVRDVIKQVIGSDA